MSNIEIIDYIFENLSIEEEKIEKLDALYYPMYLLEIDIAIKRKLGGPRIIKKFVTIDLVRKRAMLSNCFPETRNDDVKDTKLLPKLVTEEEAISMAKKKVLKSILTKVITFYAPDYEIINCKQAYKEFVLIKNQDSIKFVDTIMGHTQDISKIM